MIEADGGRHWTIGAVAQACGVTVRALHHYDRIGLLTPNKRTASGHRRYTEHDLRRLYRIRTLQALGLSLEDVADVLAGQDDDLAGLRDVLTTQSRGLSAQITRLDAIRGRIDGLLRQIDAGQMPDTHQFMTTLEMMSVYETYFTQEQRGQLAQRRAELGATAVDAAREEWTGLVEQLLPHVAANTPVDDPQVADLVTRWEALGARMSPAGDSGQDIAQAARRMWQENSTELGARLPWPTEDMTALVAYIERARQARQQK